MNFKKTAENKLNNLKELLKYFFNRVFGRQFKIFNNSAGRTAAKSKFGFWYVGDTGDSTDIAYSILKIGEIEPAISSVFINTLKNIKKDTVVVYDLGCNTGFYSILSAFIDKRVKSYGFDPVKEFCELAEESVWLNHLDNCKIFNYAVGDKEQDVTFYFSGTGTSLIPNFYENIDSFTRKVKQVKLDDFIQQQNLPMPDFVIMDIEGWELKAMLGMKETLKKNRPIIFFECLPSSNNINSMLDFFKELNYTVEKVEAIMYMAKPS
jgi:FkbM family methyltransferase